MIYATLKANKENGISNSQIFIQYEECYGCVGELFGEDYWEYDKWEIDKETNDEKLFEDFTDRQIASKCLKGLKALTKGDEPLLLIWNKIFWDIDLPDYCFEQVEELIKDGVITGSNDLKDLDKKARKKGLKIRKEICYDQENHYYMQADIDYLIDKYFPCYAELNDDYCNNCGNCQ